MTPLRVQGLRGQGAEVPESWATPSDRKGAGVAGKHTGENTGDPRQYFAVIGSNSNGRGTLLNTGSRALHSQPQ
jgi:hypothetical protein